MLGFSGYFLSGCDRPELFKHKDTPEELKENLKRGKIMENLGNAMPLAGESDAISGRSHRKQHILKYANPVGAKDMGDSYIN